MNKETIKVIIVDDHQLVRETWKLVLHHNKSIEIVGDFGSGAEAIEQSPSLSPDVILMDINMSPINGFEATRKLLKLLPDVKIIGVSINNQPGYAKNMLQLGAKGYVTKNSSKEEMITAILEVIKGKTYICREILQKMDDKK